MLLLLLACIPVPYLSPPLDLSAAIDPRAQLVNDVPVGPEALEFRVGIAPLSVVEEQRNRVLDPSLGAIFTLQHPSGSDSTLGIGGYGRLAYRAWTHRWPGGFVAAEPRVTVEVSAFDIERPGATVGPGLSFGAVFRLGDWCTAEDLCISGGNGIGVAYGESGVALGLDAGAAMRPEGLDTRILLTLELRTPASAGVIFAPILF